jgi:hypothetical protein
MKFAEENLDILQNLEFAIVEVWRAHSEMTDYTAQRAYEEARKFYRVEQRGSPPKPPALTGLDAIAFDAVKTMCEFRLGRSASPPSEPEIPVSPITVEKLIACLQELAKSVARHTRSGGRQGYLKFIDEFLR